MSSPLGRYFVRRLASLIPVLLGMSILIFGAMRLLPGDVVDLMAGMQATSSGEQRAALEKQYGLDRPLPVQYLDWLGRVARGDLGLSMRSRQPIRDDLLRKLPITVELAIISLFLATLVAVPLGVLSAVRPNTWIDLIARVVGVLGLSIPNFWLAIMLLLVSSRYFGVAAAADLCFDLVRSGQEPRTNVDALGFACAGDDRQHHADDALDDARSAGAGFRARRAGKGTA